MTYAAQTPKALRLRRSTARKARVALAAMVVAAALVVPPLVAGLAAPPAHAQTTFLVTNTNDAGAGSLRQAILDANKTAGTDAINFAVEDAFCDPNTGVATIKPQSALPEIQEQVTINGYTQAGAHANTLAVGDNAALKVELDGSSAGASAIGLLIGSSNSVIRGLAINGFDAEGILVQNASSTGNRIEGNFIGTDPSGTLDEGNGFEGVVFDGSSQNVLGGDAPGKRNVISGNDSYGIFLSGGSASRIEGNYIGTDKSGTKALSNSDSGIFVASGVSGTTIGGTTAGSRNIISGNSFDGVDMGFDSQGTRLLGNRIGTTASGKGALGNAFFGVAFAGSSTNNSLGDGTRAGANTIAFNAQDGILGGNTSIGNKISRNSVFSNGGLAIDLIGPGESLSTNIATPNDSGDKDSGPNNLQNKPSITSAKTSSTNTMVAGTLNSNAKKSYVVRFYSNPAGGGEGNRFLGKLYVRTDTKGHATFTKALAKVPVGKTVTATATDPARNTSEFSAPRTVTSV